MDLTFRLPALRIMKPGWRVIIIEISSVQSPVYLIVAGGTFNSVMRHTEAAVVKASMYALLGVIGAQTVKYPNFPSKLMISQMFSPPSFSYLMLERLNVFNSLACEMNSICGFPALPDPNSVIKFEGSPGAGQGGWYWMANGQLIDREAFRERKPLRMVIQDLKERLIDREIALYQWIPT